MVGGELEIRTADGASLRAVVDEPAAELRATLVLAHAMFARKSTFKKLGPAFAARGFRTVAFDFRGHGDSESSGAWGYDDLVRGDLPAVVECVRARSEDRPVVVVGHSLGGHVALAAQGSGRMNADAIVAVAASIWIRELEGSRARWAAKSALARAMLAISTRARRFPARRLRIGSDDASERYLRDLFRGVRTGRWTSADGRDDYLRSLSEVRVPVAAVLGTRDKLYCHPASGAALVRRCAGPREVFHATADHMGVLQSTCVFEAVDWAIETLTSKQRFAGGG